MNLKDRIIHIIENRVDSSDIDGTPEGMAEEILAAVEESRRPKHPNDLLYERASRGSALFEDYEFDLIVAGHNGWERPMPDTFEKIVFLSPSIEESTVREVFYVEFVPGTADVKSYGVR